MRTELIVSLMLSVSSAACATSQAEQVRDARSERIDDRTVARTRVIEDREAARVDTIESQHELAEAHVDATAGPGAEAAEQSLDTATDRAVYRTKAQARLDTILVRIDAAQAKLRSLGTLAPNNHLSELQSLREDHAVLQHDITELPAMPPAQWQAEHEELDDRISELNRRVKLLTETIEDA